jgi:hypothetical protein
MKNETKGDLVIPESPSEPSGRLEERVIEWLSSQGYPLEMYTAKCCRDAGLDASQSWYYFDEESGNQRETDVYAHTRRVRVTRRAKKTRDFQLSFTFECKQSRARPWVAFVHSNRDTAMGSKAAMSQRIFPKYTEAWWDGLTEKSGTSNVYPLENANPIAHSLVRVSFDRSREDAAFAALMSAAKAAIGIAYWLNQASEAIGESQLYYTVVIPVLVLDAPLFSCHLNDEDGVSVTPIDGCTLQWNNQVSSEAPTTIVEIVTKQCTRSHRASRSKIALIYSAN